MDNIYFIILICLICPPVGIIILIISLLKPSPLSSPTPSPIPPTPAIVGRSIGERTIAAYLLSVNVRYEQEKTFPECHDKRVLRFDFYLPDYRILIEVQGRQHYEYVPHFHRRGEIDFQDQLRKDQIKRDFCIKYGYQLIEIRHTEARDLYLSRIENIIFRNQY